MIQLYIYMHIYMRLLLLLNRFSRVRLCGTPETAAHQAPCPWDSPGKNTGVGCYFLLQCMKVKSESEVTQSCPTLSDPMDCSLPGSSVLGIFQAGVQEYWSGVPLPSLIYICMYIYMHTLFFILFSIMVYHRILNMVPCATQ